MNQWPSSKELDNWCHLQFQVKDEMDHTMGIWLPSAWDKKKLAKVQQFPWLVDSGVRFRAVPHMGLVFIEGFFAN